MYDYRTTLQWLCPNSIFRLSTPEFELHASLSPGQEELRQKRA